MALAKVKEKVYPELVAYLHLLKVLDLFQLRIFFSYLKIRSKFRIFSLIIFSRAKFITKLLLFRKDTGKYEVEICQPGNMLTQEIV